MSKILETPFGSFRQS